MDKITDSQCGKATCLNQKETWTKAKSTDPQHPIALYLGWIKVVENGEKLILG